MWLPPSSWGRAALPARRQVSGQGKAGSCRAVEEGMCRGGFSRSASCNFKPVWVAEAGGGLPNLLPPKGAGLHPMKVGVSPAAPQSLGEPGVAGGAAGRGSCSCCRPGAEHAGRGESLGDVPKQGCPFILLYDCILISTNTPPSPGCCQQSLYRLRLACQETPAKPWAPARGRGLFFSPRFF